MTLTGPGRPRARQATRPGATAREEILDAAAELFTTQGYATTSTRAIADAVGIRQSSLYHHFATKDDILEDLLSRTVAPGLSFARAVHEASDQGQEAASPAARLHAVALVDGSHLCGGRWNVGILYHLPEVRSERFGSFLADREELQRLYRFFGSAAGGSPLSSRGLQRHGELAFRLVESLISLRVDDQITPGSPLEVADAAVVLCGRIDDLATTREESKALIDALGHQLPAPAAGKPGAHNSPA